MSNKKRGYVIGSLFNEAEQKQRKYEGQVLRDTTGEVIDWYNPVEAPVNDKSKLPTAIDIFHGDTIEVIHADYLIADITNNDPGAAMELGIAYGLQYANFAIKQLFAENDEEFLQQLNIALASKGIKEKRLYAVCSDMRMPDAHKYEGVYIPVGFNQYLIGGILSMPSNIAANFESAVALLLKDLQPSAEQDNEVQQEEKEVETQQEEQETEVKQEGEANNDQTE